MFLSYAVVPVFVFTILLNFFCLYSPIGSQETPDLNFTTCEACLNSTCHTDTNGTCTLSQDNSTFVCVSCPSDGEVPQFPSEESCQQGCQDQTKECVCDGPCYSCVVSAGLDKSALVCDVPTLMVDTTCAVLPYGPPSASPGSDNVTTGSK